MIRQGSVPESQSPFDCSSRTLLSKKASQTCATLRPSRSSDDRQRDTVDIDQVFGDVKSTRHNSPADGLYPEGNSYIKRFHQAVKEDEVSPLCSTSASLVHSSGDLSPRFRAPPPRPGHFDQAGTLSVCSRICVRVRRERLVLPSGWPIYARAGGFFVRSWDSR